MADLRRLTDKYVAAFNARDIVTVSALLTNDFCLTDPSVTGSAPRENVTEYIKVIFKENPTLKFQAQSILVDGCMSAIHFTLIINSGCYHGVDFIVWEGEKMKSMTAYMTLQSNSKV